MSVWFKSYFFNIHGNLLQPLGDRVGHILLVPAPDMPGKEFFHRGLESNVILGSGKAVTFIRSVDIFNWKAPLAKSDNYLVAFGFYHPRVILPLHYKQGGTYAVGRE
jgi:hypothetical protein